MTDPDQLRGAFAATRKAAHYVELAAMANRFGVPLLLVRAAWTVLAFGSGRPSHPER